MEVTELFVDAVMVAWGNSQEVAEVAQRELFAHGDKICLDHDDQVSYALRIGILVGEMKDGLAVEFIARFESEILNEG